MKCRSQDSSGRFKDLFFAAGLCFLCGVLGVMVGTRMTDSNVYAEERVNAKSKVDANHKLPDEGSKGGRAWIEGTKGWEQNGNYLYPVTASDSVGIGVIPTAKLDIDGLIRIRGGTPGSDKVLTSDANGLASWVEPQQGIPSGVIVMWSGTLALVPSGWALCDGSDGTPDLRDRFIYGWSDGVNPGGTGGSTSHSHTMGNAEVKFGPNTGTVNEANRLSGLQSSKILILGTGSTRVQFWNDSETSFPLTDTYLQLQNQSTNTSSSLPPYYKLAFIMKL